MLLWGLHFVGWPNIIKYMYFHVFISSSVLKILAILETGFQGFVDLKVQVNLDYTCILAWLILTHCQLLWWRGACMDDSGSWFQWLLLPVYKIKKKRVHVYFFFFFFCVTRCNSLSGYLGVVVPTGRSWRLFPVVTPVCWLVWFKGIYIWIVGSS